MSDEMKYPFLDLRKIDEPIVDRLKAAAARVIESGRYIGGEEVAAFESELARRLGVNHVVGVSNGLDALRLIFKAYIELGRLREGDAVIVPANTYIATVLAVTDAGLRPILVDPDYATMNLKGSDAARMADQARAILPVHLYGRVAWDEEMLRLAKERDLLVVEDAAQSIGARSALPGLNGSHQAGALGNAGALSFYPTKNVGALGDAGAVATDDQALADAVRALANYGSDRRYHNIYQGYNCRLDPIQAAMLRVKLEDMDRNNQARIKLAETYDRCIDNPLIRKPLLGESVWHQYVVRTDNRDALRQYLSDHGVGTDIHYATPPHMQLCYDRLPHGDLPVTERIASEVLSLPISPATSVADAEEIAEILNRYEI